MNDDTSLGLYEVKVRTEPNTSLWQPKIVYVLARVGDFAPIIDVALLKYGVDGVVESMTLLHESVEVTTGLLGVRV